MLALNGYLEWFEGFVEDYLARGREVLAGDPDGVGPMELKRKHSLLVLEHARAISGEACAGEPELAFLAQLAALYHDVGRFPQYLEYKTFRDADSANHGTLGSRELRKRQALNGLPAKQRRMVLGAVHLHNRRELPGGISPDQRLITQVVRDADKLDILRVMAERFRRPGDAEEVIVLHAKDDPERYSQHILQDALGRASPDYNRMVYVNDFKILLAHWVFELNFAESRRRAREEGLVYEILGQLPQDEGVRRLEREVRAHLEAA